MKKNSLILSLKKALNKEYAFPLLCLLILTKPSIVDVSNSLIYLNYFWDFLRIILLTLIPIYFIFIFKKVYFVNIIIFCFLTVLIISTIINNGDIHSILLQSISIFSLSLFVTIYAKDNYINLLLAIKKLFFVYIIINLLTLVIFPNGFYKSGTVLTENWFLGNKNLFVMFFLPYIFAVFRLYEMKYFNKLHLTDFIGILSIIFSTFIAASATTLVAIFVILFSYFIFKKIRIHSSFLLVFVLFCFYIIVILNATQVFAFIIENILGKTLTLTNRTYIWKDALRWFSTSKFIGVGLQTASVSKEHLFNFAHCHCTYLHYLLIGGILGFSLFLIFLISVSFKIKKNNYIEKAFFLACLLIWISDVYSRVELFIMILTIISIINSKKYIKL